MSDQHWLREERILLTCPKGLAGFLREEVGGLGFPVLEEGVGFIATRGTLADTIRLNLWLRTAHRVLFRLREFPCRDGEALYREAVDIPWHTYIPADGYVTVSASVDHPSVRDPRFPSLKCKDALVDRIRRETGRRPDSGPDRHRAAVFVHWHGDTCAIYLDTSGEALSKRGYRKTPGPAPMQESLAAACVLASAWRGGGHVINPMCGSGTLAIEAALIGLNRAPGLVRLNYAFMHLAGFPADRLKEERAAARRAARKGLDGRVVVSDHDPRAIDAARRHAVTAGVEPILEVVVCDYRETPIPEGPGIVLLNPEYGVRMGREGDLVPLYRGIGDFLKQRCTGYTAYLFTGSLPLSREVGLKPSRRMALFSGPLECRLLEFQMY